MLIWFPVAGATGAIGRPLIAQLLAKGHNVVALTRSLEKAQNLAAQGVEPVVADVFDMDKIQAVINRVQPDVQVCLENAKKTTLSLKA